MIRTISYRIFAGILIGFANIVPGVSGGTIAVSTGIYRALIEALSVRTLNVTNPAARRNLLLLTEVGAGVILGIMVLARILEAFIARYPVVALYCFLGLICATVPTAYRYYREACTRVPPRGGALSRPSGLRVLVDGILAALGILTVLLPPLLAPASAPEAAAAASAAATAIGAGKLLLSGVLAGTAMIIPGVSGSLVLLLLGTYADILAAVNAVNIPALFLVAAGAATGILVSAKILSLLFRRAPRRVWAWVIGLLLGSLIYLWRELPGSPVHWITCIASFALAFSLTLVFSFRNFSPENNF